MTAELPTTVAAAQAAPAVASLPEFEPAAPRLRELALAAVARLVSRDDTQPASPEIAFLQRYLGFIGPALKDWDSMIHRIVADPAPGDEGLVRLADQLGLEAIELLTIALAAAVEDDAMTGRALAHVQAPVGGSRPTLGLLTAAFAPFARATPPTAALLNGAAVRSGLLTVLNESAPLPERPVTVAPQLCLALAGHDAPWPGTTLDLAADRAVKLPARFLSQAADQAAALRLPRVAGLLIRSASPAESRTAAAAVARALEMRPLYIEGDKVAGLGPLLTLRRLLPVFVVELGPGERRVLPELPGYSGPIVALGGVEGAIESPQGALPVWRLPLPNSLEREALWSAALEGSRRPAGGAREAESSVRHWAANFMHSAGRISQLGRLARHQAALANRAMPVAEDLASAAWTSEGAGLDTLAEPLRLAVPDEALVVSRLLRSQLDLLVVRCRAREGLADGLGPAAAVRYRPGVRALFTGPSGTGKTLAAGWLATRLSLPLYRVDLAGVTSKYIGETEKNLARLLAAAERDDVILLFDEADSLFGKRTDIRDSNDRFANAQTNYLLQRIENYDGIVLLTSNSKQRFDSAFARRLDLILEFPLPSPEERRALWLAHLGGAHELEPDSLNRLAALADISGGNIRNAVLAAALLAQGAGRPIQLADCAEGLEAEYRKLGRQLPAELKTPNPRMDSICR